MYTIIASDSMTEVVFGFTELEILKMLGVVACIWLVTALLSRL